MYPTPPPAPSPKQGQGRTYAIPYRPPPPVDRQTPLKISPFLVLRTWSVSKFQTTRSSTVIDCCSGEILDKFFKVDAATRSATIEANHPENDEENEEGEVKKKKKRVGFRDRKVCFTFAINIFIPSQIQLICFRFNCTWYVSILFSLSSSTDC